MEDDAVKYNDHDFPLGYKSIPCGYLLLSKGVSSLFGWEDLLVTTRKMLTICKLWMKHLICMDVL